MRIGYRHDMMNVAMLPYGHMLDGGRYDHMLDRFMTYRSQYLIDTPTFL